METQCSVVNLVLMDPAVIVVSPRVDEKMSVFDIFCEQFKSGINVFLSDIADIGTLAEYQQSIVSSEWIGDRPIRVGKVTFIEYFE